MIEMAPVALAGQYSRGFAGDSFNSAVYLARAGHETAYLSRLGDDTGSRDILAFMQSEGLDTSLIAIEENRNAGLYLIDNDANGERYFTYYRDQSPARETFASLPAFDCDAFYFTGITLAISRAYHDQLLDTIRALREQGCTIIFDPNYRPALWDGSGQAASHYRDVLSCCDRVMPTLADDRQLWQLDDAAASIDFYRECGATEVVVKGDNLIATAWHGGETIERCAEAVVPVDTTGAGDAFNAGFLAQRLCGASLENSLDAAQALAAQVVQHYGAIMPRATLNDHKQG